ncbi:MAG: hypothetical protein CFE38_08170 [Comamonadaceae bacterium PBBC1]|nr:MAG: hypothetical protein CFE38_08170 [Comamonadaceae bacterium PBBC1]
MYIKKTIYLIYNKLLNWMQKCLQINPGETGLGVTWVKAEKYLSQNVSFLNKYFEGLNKKKSIKWIRSTNFTKYGLFLVKDAFVLSVPYDSSITSKNRKIYTASKIYQPIISTQKTDTFHAMKYLMLNRRVLNKLEIKGRTVLLGAYFADSKNYFHFWLDVIGDIWYLEEMGISLDSLDHILILHSSTKWQSEILALCNVPIEKILILSDFDLIKCELLILPIRPKGGQVNPVWIVEALHKTSKWSYHENYKCKRKLYISRLDADRRKLINENDVIDLVSHLGFEVIECSKLTVEQQRKLFNSASIVIAPHGAALTNVVWMDKNSTLIELLPHQHAYPCFYDLARIIGLKYIAIECMQLDKNENPLFADVQVSLNDIINVLLEV